MNKPLYDRDFYAWTQEQADAIRRRSVNELDWENLQEEVESMGKQARSKLLSHLIVLLQHLLEWRFQDSRRTRSWALTVKEQRVRTEHHLRDNPSLKPLMDEVLAEAYEVAVIRAARETKLPLEIFPKANPFTFEAAMEEPVEWEDGSQPRSSTRKTKG